MSLELDLVAELGGDKSDLELLKGLSDDEEEVLDDLDQDLDADPINRNQLREFIKELGIKKYRDQENESKKKEKKKKLIEIEAEEEVEKEDDSTQEKEKKKKNKKNKLQHNEVSSTSTPDPERNQEARAHMQKYQARNYLLVKSGQRWFDDEANHKTPPVTGLKPDLDVEHEMETFASKLLEDEVSVYNKQREKSKKSEVGWLKTVLSSGTLSDKMAALTLLVQESPVHNLNSLDSLISMVKKKGRRESMMAAETIKELFLSYLLPDRKLRLFTQNPLLGAVQMSSGNKDILDKRILVWGFEEKLKTKYTAFIQAIDTLLTMLVNKVGDPDYKLASKASHYLTRLVDKHPNMKTVVTEEVERLLYRPNVPTKAQYYCICFLNQLLLSQEEKKLASRLINIYFSYFKAFVKKGEVESKMMSALLSGVNRAYPYAKVDSEYIHGQMDTLYKIVHIVNFNTSIQALMLLYQVMDSSESVSDRYYTALYKKMADPALKSSAKQAMFLNLLFKSMRKDLSERRIKAFIKRLLQICSYQTPQFTCGALVLLGEVDSDDEEEHFTDAVDPEETVDMPSSDSEEEHKATRETTKTKPSWVHKTNLDVPKLNATISKSQVSMGYPKGIKRIPVNSEKYLAKGEESIPVEEKFFYQYFTQKAELEKKDKEVELSDEDSEAESVNKYEDQFDQDDIDFGDTDMDFSR
ncbi:hypothetical protein KUTeg_013916 [Tegillarca granosa]|uniref:CCAAT-binding factor domain-containing protein n=1 Tax=Tegillarca granosa TaxID=220873 RepID=A0ABQ9EZJ5_TEGGR|nr:hypothetical protein KUTeg_013916 [Tegillarca granosa]